MMSTSRSTTGSRMPIAVGTACCVAGAAAISVYLAIRRRHAQRRRVRDDALLTRIDEATGRLTTHINEVSNSVRRYEQTMADALALQQELTTRKVPGTAALS